MHTQSHETRHFVLKQIELPAKLLNYFLWSNTNNINRYWCFRGGGVLFDISPRIARCVPQRRGFPPILGKVMDSAFMYAKVRLSCRNSLICTGLHTFQRHASPPRAAADGVDCTLVRSPRDFFFPKIIQPNSSFGAPEGSLSSGVRNT